ncbi:hypothetical protein K439DRAFT_1622989 [Ramaria rubella]|nr:hypothetical protein K439DRAFT_1622989 [Ramaria rubella]
MDVISNTFKLMHNSGLFVVLVLRQSGRSHFLLIDTKLFYPLTVVTFLCVLPFLVETTDAFSHCTRDSTKGGNDSDTPYYVCWWSTGPVAATTTTVTHYQNDGGGVGTGVVPGVGAWGPPPRVDFPSGPATGYCGVLVVSTLGLQGDGTGSGWHVLRCLPNQVTGEGRVVGRVAEVVRARPGWWKSDGGCRERGRGGGRTTGVTGERWRWWERGKGSGRTTGGGGSTVTVEGEWWGSWEIGGRRENDGGGGRTVGATGERLG